MCCHVIWERLETYMEAESVDILLCRIQYWLSLGKYWNIRYRKLPGRLTPFVNLSKH